jgi:hypothetical protein
MDGVCRCTKIIAPFVDRFAVKGFVFGAVVPNEGSGSGQGNRRPAQCAIGRGSAPLCGAKIHLSISQDNAARRVNGSPHRRIARASFFESRKLSRFFLFNPSTGCMKPCGRGRQISRAGCIDRANGEFAIERAAQLVDQYDVQLPSQSLGDDLSHGDGPAWNGENQRAPPLILMQTQRQRFCRLCAVFKRQLHSL